MTVPGKGGCPREYTDEQIQNVLADIDAGVPHKLACESYNVAFNAFKGWKDRGRKKIGKKWDWETAFAVSLSKSSAKDIKESLKEIKNSPKGHAGLQFHLSTKYARYYHANALERENAEAIEKLQSKINNKDKSDAEVRSEG